MMRRVGVDTGGTFTDLIELDSGRIRVKKVLSTPSAPELSVLEALEAVDGPARGGRLVHGNTVGLNSVLTGRGARVALVTNARFEDLIEIARQDRPQLYDLAVSPRPVLVPRKLRFGISDRRLADGTLLAKSSKAELARIAEKIAKAKAEAIAVCLLHSYAWPEDERRVGRALASLGLPISLSSDLLRRHREYERYSTTIMNAFIVPKVSGYLQRVATGCAPMEFHLLGNEGGSLPYTEALEQPVRTILSGPAGGAIAARFWGRLCGFDAAVGFDMGGTSADVALCVGDEGVDDQAQLGGHALALPSVPLTSVGCGGGSIAWRDAGGALRVGPQSSGADPGPACYGKGKAPTVTDAHLWLGRLPRWGLLGGSFPLDRGRSERALGQLAGELDLDLERTASGILEIADLAMARPLRNFTMGRGLDPADLCLVAFGGAGGLHAARLGALLGFENGIVPPDPRVLSAAGMLLARPVFERQLAWMNVLDDSTSRELAARAKEFGKETTAQATSGVRAQTRVFAALRYEGNQTELWVPADRRARNRFVDAFEQRFGFTQDLPVECLRLRARTTLESNRTRQVAQAMQNVQEPESFAGSNDDGAALRWLARGQLSQSRWTKGPIAIHDYSGTTIVESGWRAKLHPAGAIWMQQA